MRRISTPDLRAGLGEPRGRIDRLVADGVIVPKHDPPRGHARLWTFEEAMRLAIILALADEGWIAPFSLAKLDPPYDRSAKGRTLRTPTESIIHYLNRGLSGFADGPAFLVIGRPVAMILPTNKRGEPAGDGIASGHHELPEIEIVHKRDLSKQIAEHPAAIVVSLDALEKRLLAFWPADDVE